MEVAGYFELDASKAKAIANEVAQPSTKWRNEAALHGLGKAEVDRMSSAVGYEDLKMAVAK